MHDPRPHVVILGGGFGGLAVARALARTPVRITLVDRQNHHLFQPLLYQVATAGLSAPDIAEPIRHLLRDQDNTSVLLADVSRVDAARKVVVHDHGELSWDTLVVAVGMTHSYFGNDAWARHAPGLKTLGEALRIRRRILLAFEAAEREPEHAASRLTFVVVGAGPTGVELAGAVAEIARHTLTRNFRRVDPARARVVLIDGGDRVLGAFSARLSEAARRQLEALGVEVRLGERVVDVTAEGVRTGSGFIAAHTVLWAAGVQAAPVVATLGAPTDRAGRVRVGPDLSVPDQPDVFVVGDCACVPFGEGIVPGVAQGAMQGGAYVGRRIRDRLAGRDTPPFAYVDKGSMATIGRSKAVAQIGRVELSGFPAWVGWSALHIAFLVGFENRMVVMLQWAWAWLTWGRGARVVVEAPVDPPVDPPPAQPAG